MNHGPWPALDHVLATLSTGPSRTGSVIVTIYGDAIMRRGGSLALASLLPLMQRLGASDGVVRTAVSRLARDGVLKGRRVGRRSAYALTPASHAEFATAMPRIYGTPVSAWDGQLRIAFPEPGADRDGLDALGFALVAPGVLLSPNAAPPGVTALVAAGDPHSMQRLAARAWPLDALGRRYHEFAALFATLRPIPSVAPLDAMAARIALVHAWRRIALRDPGLPAPLLPCAWPGTPARAMFASLYAALLPTSESWLNAASDGNGPLPDGEGPVSIVS